MHFLQGPEDDIGVAVPFRGHVEEANHRMHRASIVQLGAGLGAPDHDTADECYGAADGSSWLPVSSRTGRLD